MRSVPWLVKEIWPKIGVIDYTLTATYLYTNRRKCVLYKKIHPLSKLCSEIQNNKSGTLLLKVQSSNRIQTQNMVHTHPMGISKNRPRYVDSRMSARLPSFRFIVFPFSAEVMWLTPTKCSRLTDKIQQHLLTRYLWVVRCWFCWYLQLSWWLRKPNMIHNFLGFWFPKRLLLVSNLSVIKILTKGR